MAYTALTDAFVPAVYRTYSVVDNLEKNAFVQSGVMVTDPAMTELAGGPGQLTTLPFWNDLDATVEPNYSNDVYGDVATPQKINSGTQIARISQLNEGFSSADLVKELAGSDPMKRIASRVDNYWLRQSQRRLIATAVGVFNDNVADNAGDMVVDISITTGTPDSTNQFGVAPFIDAALTLGDQLDNVSAIAMHSVVYGRALKNNEIDFLQDSTGVLSIPSYKGKRVIVDDGLPTFGTGLVRQYLSILFGPGAFGYGVGNPRVPEEVDRAPDRGNGGGIETLWTRRTWVLHPFGYKWLETTITGPGLAPTWADLKLATNWSRVLERKQIPLAFMLTNG